jgi:hypothetical protein
MNANHELERRLADFYASEAPQRAPDRVLAGAVAAIDSTRQRRALLRVPWRFPTMNSYAKVAIAVVAVIAIGAVGLAVFRPSPITGPGVVTPSGSPSSSPSGSPPPALTETFASPMNRIAVSYPAGWSTAPATVDWTTGIPRQGDPFRDLIFTAAREDIFLLIASQELGLRTGEQFISQTVADTAWGDGTCQPTTESVPINGVLGSLVTHCDGTLTAVASHGDRGYLFVLYGIDDVAWFREILASAQMG